MIRGYDARQYSLLRVKLEEFALGLIPLPKAINDVEALLTALENPDVDWTNTVSQYWLELEIIYAHALDREEAIPNYDHPDVKALIDNLVTELSKIPYSVEDE